MSYIILIAGVLSLFIEFLALKKSGERKRRLYRLPFLFCGKCLDNLKFFFELLSKRSRFFGLYICSRSTCSCLPFILGLFVCQKGNALWKHLVIYSVAVIIAGLSLFTQMILGDASKIGDVGIEINQGPLFSIIWNFFDCVSDYLDT